MAKKATRPKDGSNYNHWEFNWDRFISNVIGGKYVLVLGSEIMLSKEQNVECGGDSKQLVLNSVKDYLVEKNELGKDITIGSFTDLSRVTPNVNAKIRNEISEGIDWNLDEVSPELVSLIKTKLFRVVLTTTFDPYIELLMREVWGSELRIMNISSPPSSEEFDYLDYCRDDIPELIPPTLYYVFGKAFPAASTSRFVATDNDAIEIMYKWMGKEAPQRFLNFVRSKRLLALGCKFEDWFFRFFWYVLRGDVQELSSGEVAVTLNRSSESDLKLESFLNYCEIHFQPDARAFISEVLIKLTQYRNSEDSKIESRRKQGSVFISYAHEDEELAKAVFWHLTANGVPVWMDHAELEGGDEYESRIRNAIGQCRVFVPILSSQMQIDNLNGTHRYYRQEWKIVQMITNTGKAINVLPLRVWGYDWRNEKNIESLPQCIKAKTVFDLERQSLDEFVIRLQSLLNL